MTDAGPTTTTTAITETTAPVMAPAHLSGDRIGYIVITLVAVGDLIALLCGKTPTDIMAISGLVITGVFALMRGST